MDLFFWGCMTATLIAGVVVGGIIMTCMNSGRKKRTRDQYTSGEYIDLEAMDFDDVVPPTAILRPRSTVLTSRETFHKSHKHVLLIWTLDNSGKYILRPVGVTDNLDRNLKFHTFSWSGSDGEYKYCAAGNDVLTLEGGPEYAEWQYARNQRNPTVAGLIAPKNYRLNRTMEQMRENEMDRAAREYASSGGA